jgi:hypothetical protein
VITIDPSCKDGSLLSSFLSSLFIPHWTLLAFVLQEVSTVCFKDQQRAMDFEINPVYNPVFHRICKRIAEEWVNSDEEPSRDRDSETEGLETDGEQLIFSDEEDQKFRLLLTGNLTFLRLITRIWNLWKTRILEILCLLIVPGRAKLSREFRENSGELLRLCRSGISEFLAGAPEFRRGTPL